jgi:hypothetical protein
MYPYHNLSEVSEILSGPQTPPPKAIIIAEVDVKFKRIIPLFWLFGESSILYPYPTQLFSDFSVLITAFFGVLQQKIA